MDIYCKLSKCIGQTSLPFPERPHTQLQCLASQVRGEVKNIKGGSFVRGVVCSVKIKGEF